MERARGCQLAKAERREGAAGKVRGEPAGRYPESRGHSVLAGAGASGRVEYLCWTLSGATKSCSETGVRGGLG